MNVREWLSQAEPGECKVYHIGNLAHDRVTNLELEIEAHEWMRASDAGLVQLHFMRSPDGQGLYYAIRTEEISE